MKVLFASILAAVVLAVGASVILGNSQRTAYEAYSSDSGTRVGDPGHNLVGPNWSGNAERGAKTHSTPRS